MYTDKEFIGQKIKDFRKKQKLSQAELAEKVGLSDKHIGRIEAGKYIPSCINFLNIIETLDINISEFGINIDEPKDETRSELLKLIYTASDKELKIFLNILKVVKEK